MSALTDVVAAVVMHSSAVAFSHFGVSVEPLQVERPAPAERVIARTPRRAARLERMSTTAPAAASGADCPETRKQLQRAAVIRA